MKDGYHWPWNNSSGLYKCEGFHPKEEHACVDKEFEEYR